mgnify:FL=1
MQEQDTQTKIAELEKKIKHLESVSYVHLAIVLFGIAGITAMITEMASKVIEKK